MTLLTYLFLIGFVYGGCHGGIEVDGICKKKANNPNNKTICRKLSLGWLVSCLTSCQNGFFAPIPTVKD